MEDAPYLILRRNRRGEHTVRTAFCEYLIEVFILLLNIAAHSLRGCRGSRFKKLVTGVRMIMIGK